MAVEGAKRKLAAILSADVKDYSRLMADDEVETAYRLKAYRRLIAMRVREHRGRVVDTPGDNLLAEFPSALDATRCAVEIQVVLKNRNADLPADHRMEYRIGVHLGDVMVDGRRIYGDGVNIASRIEKLADPGGICISSTVHEQIRNKLDLEYVEKSMQSTLWCAQSVPVI
jgi:adenylate cyclase